MEFEYWAHSNQKGRPQLLVDHLEGTANLAQGFAEVFGAGEWGYCLGMLHDIGKFSEAFQRMIRGSNERVDHSTAGGVLIQSGTGSPIVMGHHGGLSNPADTDARVSKKAVMVEPVLETACEMLELPTSYPDLPEWVDSRYRQELFIRLLFSCLVDADRLDAAGFANLDRETKASPDIASLFKRFEKYQASHKGKEKSVLNEVRHRVYLYCSHAATEPRGFFRLTVPTGGGKTRSAMAFGLRHCLEHGLDRVIFAIPYTSIIEQTANVYREILGDAVLEHHSAVRPKEDDERVKEEVKEGFRGSENWDSRIIVTTNVQLLESLFSNKTSRCRKLHNFSNSVIIFDEAQSMPGHLLEPTLDVLRELVDYYGVSVVFSTATQPALEGLTMIRGLEGVREIVPDASELFETLKRVEYEVRLEPAGWRELADEIAQHRKVLLILNTIRDARFVAKLLSELRDDVLYLSGGLCGAHRRKVLAEVDSRLDEKKDLPCCLVSTQVVEAGVDFDFPTVYRAVGPLDSIVQAAGRCNREGGPVPGRVVVFSPYQRNLPKGDYRQRTDDSLAMLKQGIDLHDPGTYESYFRNYYEIANLDKKKVQDSRHSLQFRETAQRYKLIEDSISIVVPYDEYAEATLASIDPSRVSRHLFRKLQPYMVSIHPNQQAKYEADGLLMTIADGLIVWKGKYDEKLYGMP